MEMVIVRLGRGQKYGILFRGAARRRAGAPRNFGLEVG